MSHIKNITEKNIPVIQPKSNEEIFKAALKVFADNEKAVMFISAGDGFSRENKIVIIWDKPNKKYDKEFTTKYYTFKEPNILEWGHDQEFITIEQR